MSYWCVVYGWMISKGEKNQLKQYQVFILSSRLSCDHVCSFSSIVMYSVYIYIYININVQLPIYNMYSLASYSTLQELPSRFCWLIKPRLIVVGCLVNLRGAILVPPTLLLLARFPADAIRPDFVVPSERARVILAPPRVGPNSARAAGLSGSTRLVGFSRVAQVSIRIGGSGTVALKFHFLPSFSSSSSSFFSSSSSFFSSSSSFFSSSYGSSCWKIRTFSSSSSSEDIWNDDDTWITCWIDRN